MSKVNSFHAETAEDLANWSARDVARVGKERRWTLQSKVNRAYEDSKAGQVWDDEYEKASKYHGFISSELDGLIGRRPKMKSVTEYNLMDDLCREYRSGGVRIFLSPELGQVIDRDWTRKDDRYGRYPRAGRPTMKTILSRLGLKKEYETLITQLQAAKNEESNRMKTANQRRAIQESARDLFKKLADYEGGSDLGLHTDEELSFLVALGKLSQVEDEWTNES